MEWITSAEGWAALLTLAVLEIVLGIDNIIFIALLAGKLPADQRERARRTGLFLAMFIRIGLLLSIAWVMGLTAPLVTLLGRGLTGRDLILLGGGLFLIFKSTQEIHDKLEGAEHGASTPRGGSSFVAVIAQILALDIVFSIDSVITAVGMAEHLEIMIGAVVIAILVMMVAAGPVADFIHRNPTVKMLGLSFLLLIGVALVADAAHFHIPRAYIYFAIAFSSLVEALNTVAAKRRTKRKKI